MAALLLNRGAPMFSRSRNQRGFTVTEMLMVVSMIGVLAAIGLPILRDMSESIKLNEAARLVEREMQDARLKAVSVNRVMRVRMNCPAAGYIRSVRRSIAILHRRAPTSGVRKGAISGRRIGTLRLQGASAYRGLRSP